MISFIERISNSKYKKRFNDLQPKRLGEKNGMDEMPKRTFFVCLCVCVSCSLKGEGSYKQREKTFKKSQHNAHHTPENQAQKNMPDLFTLWSVCPILPL
jgi:hypothetical protein